MKICTVRDDLSSKKSRENYPTNLFCEECFHSMNPDAEDSGIISYHEDDGSFGNTCSKCGKTKKEEIEEGQ